MAARSYKVNQQVKCKWNISFYEATVISVQSQGICVRFNSDKIEQWVHSSNYSKEIKLLPKHVQCRNPKREIVEIAIVLDCSNIMQAYVERLKEEICSMLTSMQEQKKVKSKVALVTYVCNENNNTTKTSLPFTDDLCKILQSMQLKHAKSTFEPKSKRPIDVHSTVGVALNFRWSLDASKRILILIGGNPPHGVKYHKLGRSCDKYPEGILSPKDFDILLEARNKKIDFFIVSIDNALDQFHQVLTNIGYMTVTCVKVQNENDLIKEMHRTILEIKPAPIIKNDEEDNDEKKNNQMQRMEEDFLDANEIKCVQYKSSNNWCPVLVFKKNNKTAKVWDGDKVISLTVDRLTHQQNCNKATMDAFEKLLSGTYGKHKKKEDLYQQSQARMRKMQQMINSKLRFDDTTQKVKWLKMNNMWYPVWVIQENPILNTFVLDWNNKLKKVAQDALLNEPPYTKEEHIASHVEKLKILSARHPWKSPIECGKTQCCWTIKNTNWYSKDERKTGTIIYIRYITDYDTCYAVKPADSNELVLQSTKRKSFKLLDSNSRIIEENRALKHQLETEETRRTQLDDEIMKLERKVKSLKSQLTESQDACHAAITLKQDTEGNFKNILKQRDRFDKEIEYLKKQNKELQDLVNKFRDDRIENSSALDVTRGFPPVQDIVRDFALVKSQYHVEAAKLIKKILKKKNSDYSRLRNYKIVSNMLFDILMKSFQEMKKFEQQQYDKIATVHNINEDENKQRILERMVKDTYKRIVAKIKKDKAQEIVNCCKHSYGLNEYFQNDSILLSYVEECISICWVIVLVRDPHLSISPQIFDESENNIGFDEKSHIEGFGSDTEQCLNFVVWPSIVRKDTDYNISQLTGVFIQDIPQWNKKYLKKIKNQMKANVQPKRDTESEQKNEEDIYTGIGNGNGNSIVEIEIDHAENGDRYTADI